MKILLDFTINDENETGAEQNIISEQKVMLLRNALVIINIISTKTKATASMCAHELYESASL